MYVLLALGFISFLLCFTLTPLVRDLALEKGWAVDLPDKERKLHLRAVPRLGGLAIVLSCLGAFACIALLYGSKGKVSIQHGQVLHGVLPAAGVVFLVGLLDDLRNIKPWQKLAGQAVAAALAVELGVRLSLHHLSPGAGFAISFIWLICCTNAVNLIDGMDGLATGVSLMATVTVLIVALLFGHFGLAIVTAPLAGALIAFLYYNFSPASIFLGDCGSLTVGFILGCLGLVWGQHATNMLGLAAPLMALALPLTDVGLSIGRRFLRNDPIFKADRGHIHHRVLDLGFSTPRAALILYAACCAFASLAVLASVDQRAALPLLLIFLAMIGYGVNRLDYHEFRAARQAVGLDSVRQAVRGSIRVSEFEDALRRASSPESCWEVLRTACRDLHFSSVRLEMPGHFFYEQFQPETEEFNIGITLSLGHGSTMLLTRTPEEMSPRITMRVIHRLQKVMQTRVAQLTALPLKKMTAA